MSKKITKDSLLYLIANWKTQPIEQIAAHCGVSIGTIIKWASGLRNRGVDLPKQSVTDFYLDSVAADVKRAEAVAKNQNHTPVKPEDIPF